MWRVRFSYSVCSYAILVMLFKEFLFKEFFYYHHLNATLTESQIIWYFDKHFIIGNGFLLPTCFKIPENLAERA